MSLVGTVIGGRFELGASVGSGGMGTVFRARDREGTDVAVKVLHQGTSGARFSRECETLSSLAHPGIVRYVAHGDHPTPFLAMEWVQGPTLASHLDRVGLDLQETAIVIGRLADALASAHRANVVHRDLKPSNVIFRDGDLRTPILIDFGIAHAMQGIPLTRTGMTLGTPGYMAPEQAAGLRELDGRADVFGLGCLLYECITGVPAFTGANQLAVQSKILLSDPDPASRYAPELPPALEELVAVMLAKLAADRPPASAVAERLAALAPELPPTRRRTTSAMLATPTEPVAAPPHLRCAVMCTSIRETPPPDVLEHARARFAPQVDSLHVLHDGTLIAEVRGDDPAAAERAARLALELRDALPDHVVVATCTTSGRDALDRGASLVASESMRALFTATAEAIYIDREMVRRLGPSFRVEPTDEGGRLL